MKNCAYCEKNCSSTKEHIWPKSLIQKYEDRLSTYSKINNKFYFSDPVIKDVCKICNNPKLNKLDTYISSLYDEFFSLPLSPGEGTEIKYNYNLLLRSLLKISYNSSRTCGNSKIVDIHSRYKKYILEGGYCSNIMLRLQIVTSANIRVNGELSSDILDVATLRCADIAYDGRLSDQFIIRLVSINSFWFYIIISIEPEPKYKWQEFVQEFSSWKIQPGIKLVPSTKKNSSTRILKISRNVESRNKT
jgi:hypothetical protein